MFLGHIGLGFAAKKINKRPSLGTLFFATQFIDLVWVAFLIFGIENVLIEPGNTAVTPINFVYYPFSHGFLGVLFWSILFGIVYYFIRKDIKSALLTGSLVMSHWILDLLSHKPDLPLAPWSEIKVGFGLWNSVILTLLIEGIIFFGGAFIYYKTTSTINKKSSVNLWSMIVFLTVVDLLKVFGPVPPSEEPILIIGLSLWIYVAWAYWIDKNRYSVN